MFFTPFLYTIKTRYPSLEKVTVYFITYIFAELLLYWLQLLYSENIVLTFNFIMRAFLIFILALSSYVNIYELGYLWNDTETIKKETNPTIRLTDSQLSFYEEKKVFIYLGRICFSIFVNFILFFLISFNSFIAYVLCELVTVIVYALYNKIRSSFCHFLYFLLISLRYLSITLCNIERFDLSVFISCLFIFPIIRTMEYKAHYTEGTVNLFFRKYIIKYDVSKITNFRVIGTFILLIISVVLFYIRICKFMPVICCIYIFTYRLLLFVFIRNGKKFKGYLQR